jgi:hypothetical protein
MQNPTFSMMLHSKFKNDNVNSQLSLSYRII